MSDHLPLSFTMSRKGGLSFGLDDFGFLVPPLTEAPYGHPISWAFSPEAWRDAGCPDVITVTISAEAS